MPETLTDSSIEFLNHPFVECYLAWLSKWTKSDSVVDHHIDAQPQGMADADGANQFVYRLADPATCTQADQLRQRHAGRKEHA